MSERDVQRVSGASAGGLEGAELSLEHRRLLAERGALEAELAELRSEIEKRKTESKVLAARVTGLRDLCARLQERAQVARHKMEELEDSDDDLEPPAEQGRATAEPLSLGDLEAELIEMGFDIQPVTAKRTSKDDER